MRFDLTPEQRQLEREMKEYLKTAITRELLDEMMVNRAGGGPNHRKFIRKLGEDGWLGMGWPSEYGGQARSAIEQYIVFNMVQGYHGINLPCAALNTIGPTIMKYGSEAQKKEYLPGIIKGELEIALGYTEPEAGTDLASLKTRAVRDGDDYIVNGTKVFTSHADFCDYIWLAARTDPNVVKHKGISIFMVPIHTPGITIKLIRIMGQDITDTVFYDNVRIPRSCLIGEENKGWKYMVTQLGLERVMMVPHGIPERALEDITQWAKENRFNGAPVIEQTWVKNELADLWIGTEILKLFNYYVAWRLMQGLEIFAEASMIKVFGSEHIRRVHGTCLQIMGQYGQLEPGSRLAPFQGKWECEFVSRPHILFGGGVNDAMRDTIATLGMGLPKSR